VKRVAIAALNLALLTTAGVTAQSKGDSIQGVWRVVEATVTGPAARTIPFGERPNLTLITAKHYSRVEVQADGPRPVVADVAKATADELRAVWGPFVAEAGTYEVTAGGLVTMRPIASKNPAVMGPGVFITYAYKLDGNTLSLTQQRNQKGPFENPFTLKLVRVE
jgi:lipocalin-like protein